MNIGCFSNLGMVGGKQQLSLEAPECSDNRMKGFQACMLKGNYGVRHYQSF